MRRGFTVAGILFEDSSSLACLWLTLESPHESGSQTVSVDQKQSDTLGVEPLSPQCLRHALTDSVAER